MLIYKFLIQFPQFSRFQQIIQKHILRRTTFTALSPNSLVIYKYLTLERTNISPMCPK